MSGSKSRYWTGCTSGKRSYFTRKDARAARRETPGDGLGVYRCNEQVSCLGWHVGHIPHDVKRGNIARSAHPGRS